MKKPKIYATKDPKILREQKKKWDAWVKWKKDRIKEENDKQFKVYDSYSDYL